MKSPNTINLKKLVKTNLFFITPITRDLDFDWKIKFKFDMI